MSEIISGFFDIPKNVTVTDSIDASTIEKILNDKKSGDKNTFEYNNILYNLEYGLMVSGDFSQTEKNEILFEFISESDNEPIEDKNWWKKLKTVSSSSSKSAIEPVFVDNDNNHFIVDADGNITDIKLLSIKDVKAKYNESNAALGKYLNIITGRYNAKNTKTTAISDSFSLCIKFPDKKNNENYNAQAIVDWYRFKLQFSDKENQPSNVSSSYSVPSSSKKDNLINEKEKERDDGIITDTTERFLEKFNSGKMIFGNGVSYLQSDPRIENQPTVLKPVRKNLVIVKASGTQGVDIKKIVFTKDTNLLMSDYSIAKPTVNA